MIASVNEFACEIFISMPGNWGQRYFVVKIHCEWVFNVVFVSSYLSFRP